MATASTGQAEPHELLTRLMDPANRADPYPLLAQFRDRPPLLLPDMNVAVFSTYRDCDEVLRHPASSSDRTKSTMGQRLLKGVRNPDSFRPPGFLFMDPPDHTRLRQLVGKAFAPKVVSGLQAEIGALVDGLLDRIAEKGRFNAVEDFSYPLQVSVICRLLGVPIEDEPQFSDATAQLAQSMDPFVVFTGSLPSGFEEQPSLRRLASFLRASRWSREYFHDLIEERRSQAREDFISGLIAVEESGDQLTEDEIIATCMMLLIAGHETTVNLIANAILVMLREPVHWKVLSADPGRAAAIVEETMRYDPPVQVVGRTAAADMTIGGVEIPAGDAMMLLLAAAQRDPAEFDRPDTFEPDRKALRHLGFSRGIHYCLGAPLARLVAGMALSAVTARFPAARLDGEPQYKANLALRGMSDLPVTT
ncbi:cytochrome P450 [Mycobacterium parmense]|uniref:Cytochrome P450 n=1 Tax=Mycobacterium parmense TaxID=185642 RepID=A0A7I7YXW1_9MYCO|nr:cytochrome P450 [Mycobacterium parmense]MCV7352629.1 cytochrome P450 [Mycobacterium parmense]ORW54555.1 cytochrome [Mycobacterium parmense]BBZ46636.1 cytochrome P450 [Mycobacterium parmense]